MPPGAAVLDFDGDGREDIFVAGRGRQPALPEPRRRDLRGRRREGRRRGPGGGSRRALAFDYDNDGWTDLYVTYLFRPNLLYRNRGDGTFEEVGRKAGVALNDYCTSAAALDYDRDGRPDLYVLVYGHPDRGPNIQANNAPPNHLFRNNGDGTFTDVSKASRTDDTGWGLAVESADLDGDGWPDLYIANDFGNNTYLRNNGDGTFTQHRAEETESSIPASAWASRWTIYDGDGRLDFYVSNYSFPYNWFLRDPRFPMPEFPYSLGPAARLAASEASLARLLALPAGQRRDGRVRARRPTRPASPTPPGPGAACSSTRNTGRPAGPLRRQRHGDRAEPEGARDRLLEPDELRVQKFEKGIPTGDFGDDSLWGHPPEALLPEPGRPPFRRGRGSSRASSPTPTSAASS